MEKIHTKKILLVEDDKDFLWLLTKSLETEDVTVIIARDGEEGLVLAQKENPDLIVVDILMPKMDGIRLAKRIKEEGIGAKIIFLTNLKDLDYISRAIDAARGADYIIKSDMHIDEIVRKIKNKIGI